MSEKNTVILGLTNGTEIIADVEIEGASFIVTNALEIMRQMDDTGAMRMGLTPWMPYADKSAGISIPLATAIIAVPGEELKNAHARAFSKIITADSSLILPS